MKLAVPSPTNSVNSATIWLVDGREIADAALRASFAWLNPDERQRHARYLRPERQRQFLLGRWLLRHLLAESLALTPQQIVLHEREHNAPLLMLDTASTLPHFSLSHSGPWVACALSMQCALGLDIELLNPNRDLTALAEQAFDSTELANFSALPEPEKLLGFYRLWSRKEAGYKLCCNSGESLVGSQFALEHTALSMFLCSALALAAAPVIAVPDWLT